MGKKLSGRSTQPIGGNVLYEMNDEDSFYVTLHFSTYGFLDGAITDGFV